MNQSKSAAGTLAPTNPMQLHAMLIPYTILTQGTCVSHRPWYDTVFRCHAGASTAKMLPQPMGMAECFGTKTAPHLGGQQHCSPSALASGQSMKTYMIRGPDCWHMPRMHRGMAGGLGCHMYLSFAIHTQRSPYLHTAVPHTLCQAPLMIAEQALIRLWRRKGWATLNPWLSRLITLSVLETLAFYTFMAVFEVGFAGSVLTLSQPAD